MSLQINAVWFWISNEQNHSIYSLASNFFIQYYWVKNFFIWSLSKGLEVQWQFVIQLIIYYVCWIWYSGIRYYTYPRGVVGNYWWERTGWRSSPGVLRKRSSQASGGRVWGRGSGHHFWSRRWQEAAPEAAQAGQGGGRRRYSIRAKAQRSRRNWRN